MLQSPAGAGPDPAAKELPQSANVSFAGKMTGKLTALRRILCSRIYVANTATIIDAGLVRHCGIIVVASTRQGAANVPMFHSVLATR
jgi:hypothetical protein